MRQGPNPKRSRGRNNGRRPNMPLRMQTFDSNGPDVRIRGSAYQVHEKYLQLARDASSSGDRIMAESYLQHAEHYYRIIAVVQEQQNANDQNRRPRQDGQGYGGQDYRGPPGDEMSGEGGDDYAGDESGEGGHQRHDQNYRQQSEAGYRPPSDAGYRPPSDAGHRPQPDTGYRGQQDGAYRQSEGQYRSQGEGSYRPQPNNEMRPREYSEQPEPVQEDRPPQWEANGGGSDESARQETLFVETEQPSVPTPPRRGRPRRERAPVVAPQPIDDPEPNSEG